MPRVAGMLASAMLATACGDSSSPPSAPSPAPPPVASVLLTLSGTVTDDAGGPIAGAVVSVLDGANVGKAAITDSSGRYNLTGLSAGGFSIRVRLDGFEDSIRAVTLTTAGSADVKMSKSQISLSGALSGSFVYTSNSDPSRPRFSWPMTATVTQSGTAIAGTFRIQTTANAPESDWTGSFTGTLSSVAGNAQFAGSLTITGIITSGNGRCNGTRSETAGSATPMQLTLSAPGLWRWQECISTREDVVITLNKPAPAGPRSR